MKKCNCCGRIYVTERDYMRGTTRWRKDDSGHLYFNCSCKSTMLILAGKNDWYDPRSRMSEHAVSVFNRLGAVKSLPLLPEVAVKIQTLLSDENVSLEELVRTSKGDPLFSMNIIKTANASRMPGSAEIFNVKEAITYIGRRKLSELAIPAAMVNFEFKTTKYDKQRFWSEAFTTGILAESLGKRYLKPEEAEKAYFAGIFSNVGKVVGAILLPEEVDRVYESTTMLLNPMNWSESERENEVFDHHILGEIAATIWGLPQELSDSIHLHHQIVDLKKQSSGGVSDSAVRIHHIATFANQLSHLVRLESHRMDVKIFESCLVSFELSEKEIAEIVESFGTFVEKTNALLSA